MEIRRATPEDAAAIRQVHHAAIRLTCASAYSAEEIEAWTSVLTPEGYVRGMSLFEFLVAEERGEILGFSVVNVPGSELNALYVAPSSSGHGAGTALLHAAENLASDSGVTQLSLKSTLNAVSFYERSGYVQVGPAIHPLPSGRKLSCVAMVKQLSARSGS